MTSVQDFFDEKIKLPSPPAIALKILEAVRRDENSFDELAMIISADPALSLRIMKIANSALYSLPRSVESLSQATALIGTNALKNIALSFVIVENFQNAPQGSFDMDLFWRRAITAAVAAETLAKYIQHHNQELFLSGLLQDIGVLLLYLADPVMYTSLQDQKRLSDKSTCAIEQEQLGYDHSEIGSHLLASWGLPENIYQPIRYHHTNTTNTPHGDTARILQLADKISAIYHGLHSNSNFVAARHQLVGAYQLSEEDADRFIDTVGEKSREILALFAMEHGEVKPFSLIMQEANDELSHLNFSYAQLVLELKQAKQGAEQLAMELQLANESLRKLAFRDGLTNLYNHRYFQEILAAEIERSRRYNHPLSLILVDIDFFKKINDRLGHPAGDHVLQQVASMLLKLVRHCDIVARYGGEEFVIILPETAVTGARVLAQRVRRGIEQMEINYNDQTVSITISCGLASNEKNIQELTRSVLIERSDQALYRAKENGRNRVEV